MVSENNDEQKLRWQKMKNDLKGKLGKDNDVKPSKFDKLTDKQNFNTVKKREYPVGAESIFVEAGRNKTQLGAEERKKLASLQVSIKKISEVLKKVQVEKPPAEEIVETPAREFTTNIPKEEWDLLFNSLTTIRQGEQPLLHSELSYFIIKLNKIVTEHIDVILQLLKNDEEQHSFSKILSPSYLSVAQRSENDPLELIIIRFSKSQKKLIMIYLDELPNEKEKKELLVSFLLGQNPKFLITHKEAKKLAFQKSVASRKFKN
ncbi:hypothetical protein [Candidatus Uabimicrobium amorphum]|uniref:Uncharacterized protein n=1 Tax=Uabimicrobium amorphum TaxID=2596890 RepID=A0A5S9IRD8_UABAM|nr:hypothetical protein [Candidatus Uabimicrobium amorphum]BBM85285.1 hypothetical protein UABAM_03649 [Candidatus Uabimicrobium amorphum]